MTNPQDRPDIAALANAALDDDAKATPGPWKFSYYGEGQSVVSMPRERSFKFHPTPKHGGGQAGTVYGAPGIAHVLPGDKIVGVNGNELDDITEREYDLQRQRDAAFIAAARTREPLLARAVLEQAKALKEIVGILEQDATRYPHRVADALETAREALAPRPELRRDE